MLRRHLDTQHGAVVSTDRPREALVDLDRMLLHHDEDGQPLEL